MASSSSRNPDLRVSVRGERDSRSNSPTSISIRKGKDVSRDSPKDFFASVRDRIKSSGPTELVASFPSVSQQLESYIPYHRSFDTPLLRPETLSAPHAITPLPSPSQQTMQSNTNAQINPLELEVQTMKSLPTTTVRSYWRNPVDVNPTLEFAAEKMIDAQTQETLDEKKDVKEKIPGDQSPAAFQARLQRSNERVLVIGQDLFAGGIVSAVLTHAGYSVVVSATGKEAQTIVQEQASIFTAIVLQATLPDFKPNELIPFLRITLGKEIPIAVIASSPNQAGLEDCFELGADEVMHPPYNHILTKQRLDTLITFVWMKKRVQTLTQDCRLLCTENESLYRANVSMQQRIVSLENYLQEQKHILYENVLIRAQQEEVSTERENSKMMAHALMEKTQEAIKYRRQLLVMQDRAEFLERQLEELSSQTKGISRPIPREDSDSSMSDSSQEDGPENSKVPTIRFGASAPDWIHLISNSPQYQILSWTKYLSHQISLRESTDVAQNAKLSNSFLQTASSMVVSLQARLAEFNGERVIRIQTPKTTKNPLLREWLEYTFGRTDHISIPIRATAEVKAEPTQSLDSFSVVVLNDSRRDSQPEPKQEESTGVRRRTSSGTQVRRISIMNSFVSEARRGSRTGRQSITAPTQNKVQISSFIFNHPHRREWNIEAKHMFEHGLTADVRAMSESLRFDSWRLPDRVQLPLVLHFFTYFGLLERFFIPLDVMQALILAIRDTSGSGSFNNFTRSVDVIQGAFFLLLSSSVPEYVTELDILCLLVVAMSVTLEHPGFTSRFLEKTRHNLYLLHGNQSTIEKHMHRVLHTLLSCSELNIFGHLAEAQITEAHETISILFQNLDLRSSHAAIITRLAAHLPEFRHLSNPHSDREKQFGIKKPVTFANRMMILSSVLNLSTHVFLCRPAYIMHKWKDLMMEELNAQGAYEKANHISLTPFATRRIEDETPWNLCMFMCDYILNPLLHHLRHLFTGFDVVANVLAKNRNNWSQEALKKVMLGDQSRTKPGSPQKLNQSNGEEGVTSPTTTLNGARENGTFSPIIEANELSAVDAERYDEEEDAFHYIPECIRDIVKLRTAKHFDPASGPTSLSGPAPEAELRVYFLRTRYAHYLLFLFL
eukprot:TRINITY_DN9391_c0_g1_i2.p1 TRINITY_DN9391_c0_g1~~TRINITY_DN9391_c0_g1_i2.p1  ORF type:complete len:1122 (+),score=222.65 TRINITY_DN9391_c0_g1_i2:57-3422(+)